MILNILYIILWYDYGRCPNFKEIVNVILHDLCTNDILGLPLPNPSRPRQIIIDDIWLWFCKANAGRGGGPLYKCPSSLLSLYVVHLIHNTLSHSSFPHSLPIPSHLSTTKTFSKFWPKIKGRRWGFILLCELIYILYTCTISLSSCTLCWSTQIYSDQIFRISFN